MADLEKMTMEKLRALARDALGPGHSRFKKKAELVQALKAVGAGGPGAGKKAGAAAKPARKASPEKAKAAPATARAVSAKAKAAAKDASARVKVEREAPSAGRAPAAKKEPPAAKPPEPRGRERSEPLEGSDPEGYFVARVRGEEAVREAPHPLTEGAPAWLAEEMGEPAWEERLGDVPWGYGDDAFVALPRDPRTLFVYWDLSRETIDRGFEGLDHPRAQLWIFLRSSEGWGRLRTVEFALESRGFYVHDLEPGRDYRAEIHAVDRHGRERLLARPSNPVMLPPVGPSPIVDDRFVRISWDMALGRIGAGHPGGPFSDEARALLARLSDWARFGGATSSVGAGGRGRPTSPVSSPSSPFGPFAPRDE